ncbi:MAG TPA: multidrug ABC transporter ATP-binding protein [Flavobacteriales bacterium]|nr:multidrug ABC transporter ATP-binding protein [Flavobacteriales bacterium]
MEEESKKIDNKTWKKFGSLYTFLLPHKWIFSLGLLFLALSSLTTLAFPLLLGRIFDESTLERINDLGFILLGIFLLNAIFSFFRIYIFEYVSQRTLADMRQKTFSRLITLPLTFFNERRVGELNSRLSADLTLLQSVFTTTTAEFLRQIVTILGGIVMLSFISMRLTFFMLALVPVIAIVAVIFGRFIRKLSKETQQKIADSNTIVEESLQAIQSVKAFANEYYELNRYTGITNDVVKVAMKAAAYRGAFVSFIIFGLFGSIIGVIWYGLILKESGVISGGDLFSFVLYTVFVGASIGGIADLYSQILKAVGATENLMEILEEEGEDVSLSDGVIPNQLKGSIHFNKVDFHYPNREDIEVLHDIEFKANAGDVIGLAGASGAGKSTIASLIYRFYDVQKGEILIDGKDIQSFNLTELRREMAIVPQEVILFGGSIRENIGYGKPGASDEEIVQAAAKANAMEFIDKFPEGLDTLVGERGVQLSGGQRQRIAIARAVLKNPSILILDEATSALDSESEKLVQDALQKLMSGRTSIVIAHRLSTIRNANTILVLKGGKIVEMGSWNELTQEKKGVFQNMLEHQFELKS